MLKEKQMVCREKGKASCVMGGMQFLSPAQQCQGAAEAIPALGTGATRTESRREQGKGSETDNGRGGWMKV